MMKLIIYLGLVLVHKVTISSLVSASSRPFGLNRNNPYHPSGYVKYYSRNSRSIQEVSKVEEEDTYRIGESKIGSNPPNCVNKCHGCTPCEATEVPATTGHRRDRVRAQYTNYEPEGWKCKCGPSFYSP